jgi:hypothetical protein
MPVQFVCQQCRQKLSVSQRKRGAVVSCPKCGCENRVPDESAAPAAMASLAASPPDYAAIPEVVVFDDIPAIIAQQERIVSPPPSQSASSTVVTSAAPAVSPPPAPPGWAAASAPITSAPITTTPAASSPAGVQTAPVHAAPRAADVMARLKSRPEDALLLLSRRAVYALAGLLFGVALLGFAAGYLIGRGRPGAAIAGGEEAAETAAADPVALEGSLIYSASPGQYQPDAEALVLALPVEKRPTEKLSLTAATVSNADAAAANAVHGLGGAFVHANSDGEFQLVVPRSGDYYLLLVSKHVKRAADKPIEVAVLHELGAYLANPSELIGAYKYVWSQRRLAGAPAPVTEDFGADGK